MLSLTRIASNLEASEHTDTHKTTLDELINHTTHADHIGKKMK